MIESWNGDEEARLLDGPDTFDVLFTDVMMPGVLDGVGVAMHARSRHPMIHVLIVSGYAPHLVARLDALKPPIHFMGKPYDRNAARATRAVSSGTDGSGRNGSNMGDLQAGTPANAELGQTLQTSPIESDCLTKWNSLPPPACGGVRRRYLAV